MMRAGRMLGRYRRLPRAERALLVRLVPLIAVIRTSLWLVSLSTLRRLLHRGVLTVPFPERLVQLPVERLAWAVEAASRPVPAATCLTQCLALQFLLAQSGRRSSVHIGVAKNEGQPFQAHAWIDCAGQILLDRAEDVACYTPLVCWEDR